MISQFIALDYDQVELRVVADLSGDGRLIQTMCDPDGDAHTDTARVVFGTDSPTPEQRRVAKITNFGIIYDVQPYGLHAQLATYNPGAWSLDACTEFIAVYNREHPGIGAYKERQWETARKQGYVRDLFGRQLWVPEVYSSREYTRAEGKRKAINGPVTMTAQGIIRRAMATVYRYLNTNGLLPVFYPILQIHDELLFEVGEAAMVHVPAVQALMEHTTALPSGIPLRVSVKRGKSLGDLEEVEGGEHL